MTKENYIENYNNLMNAIIATHNDLKIKSQLAYENAVRHAKEFGDWFLFADFINKLLVNKIATGQHLFNVMKATNEKLIYQAKKASIKQDKDFNKENTVILDNIWLDKYTGKTEKQAAVFDEVHLLLSIQNLIKKAIKNNIDKEKITQAFNNASI